MCCFLLLFYIICRFNLIFVDLYLIEFCDVRDEVFDDFFSNYGYFGFFKYGYNNRRLNVSFVSL